MKCISSLLFQDLSNLFRFLYFKPPVHILVPAQPANDGEIRTYLVTHRIQNVLGKSSPPINITSISVASSVGKGGQKRADEISMGHMKLKAVGTRVLNPLSCH